MSQPMRRSARNWAWSSTPSVGLARRAMAWIGVDWLSAALAVLLGTALAAGIARHLDRAGRRQGVATALGGHG
jgi:hypothetical protein